MKTYMTAEKIMIPKFQCTDDALDWGRTASIEQIQAIKRERLNILGKIETLNKNGYVQEALCLAFHSQFYREAMESYWRENHDQKNS